MINFFMNGNPLDVQLENEKTVGDIFYSFEQTCEENEAAVIGIVVDDKNITSDLFDDIKIKSIDDVNKIEFTVVTKNTIKESFATLSKLFDELSAKMENVPVDLQNGKNKEVSESIKNLADSIDQFCHISVIATLFPETFKITTINDMNFNDFFADLSSILKDFEGALENNDTVLIGDLSEYEICPRLQSISNFLKTM